MMHLISLVLCSALTAVTWAQWTLTAPKTLEAFPHSCVIIRCEFQYGQCNGGGTPIKGIWYKGDKPIDMDPDLKDRTYLLGNVKEFNCTLKIDSLTESDSGTYTFRVEGKTEEDGICHYTFHEHPVKLTVQKSVRSHVQKLHVSMNETTVGSLATVTCSIPYTCQSTSPQLSWNNNGSAMTTVETLEEDLWMISSKWTFLTKESDLDTNITCTAEQNKSKEMKSILINLGYPPRIKEESHCQKETDELVCLCEIESRPHSTINWVVPSGLTYSNSTYLEPKIVLHKANLSLNGEFPGKICCNASNHHGNAILCFKANKQERNNSALYFAVLSSIAITAVVLVVFLLLWRCRNQKKLMQEDNIAIRQREISQSIKRFMAPRRKAPAVPPPAAEGVNNDYVLALPPGPPLKTGCEIINDEESPYIMPIEDPPLKTGCKISNDQDGTYIMPLEDPPLKTGCKISNDQDGIYIAPLEFQPTGTSNGGDVYANYSSTGIW